jgi:hypothetical protein
VIVGEKSTLESALRFPNERKEQKTHGRSATVSIYASLAMAWLMVARGTRLAL